MIEISKVHPIFDQILADHFFHEQPAENPLKNIKLQPRKYRNEDYLEHHESREELEEEYSGGYERGVWY